ncbi:MAG: hypothetical protein WC631_02545 [Candidatus Paceibacterota bacterium]|jgi:hypothetical protein
MQNMLSEALQEFLGLLKQLIANLLGQNGKEIGEELKKFNRGEPCWAGEMMYIPLEWAPADFQIHGGEKEVARMVVLSNEVLPPERCWRVPTINELHRGLEGRTKGFIEDVFYYSNTPEDRQPGLGNKVLSISRGHICGSSFHSLHNTPCLLRLCRPKKLD